MGCDWVEGGTRGRGPQARDGEMENGRNGGEVARLRAKGWA